VNDPAFIQTIRSLNPDLVLVNGTRVISAQALSEIKCPVINVHVGITPLYRGVHGAYWALAKNDKANCGVTIHAIDKGIDTGGILAQGTIVTSRTDNFITYPYLQFEKAIELVKKVVPVVLNKGFSFLAPPAGVSKLWYHPTIWQYLGNRFKGIK
jgi:methionyl-tRNA formyltransferase